MEQRRNNDLMMSGKKRLVLLEIWGGLGNSFHALQKQKYTIPKNFHYYIYDDYFLLPTYELLNNRIPQNNVSNIDLSNVHHSRYSDEGFLIKQNLDIMTVFNNKKFYENENYLEVVRIAKECKAKFIILEVNLFKHGFRYDYQKSKTEIIKLFTKKMLSLGYNQKSIAIDNSEYFSLIKQKRLYLVFWLDKYVIFNWNELELEQIHYLYKGSKKIYKVDFWPDKKSTTIRMPKKEKSTVIALAYNYKYRPKIGEKVHPMFQPPNRNFYFIHRKSYPINEVRKMSDDKRTGYIYVVPKIGTWRKKTGRNYTYLRVQEVPVRELLLQYGFTETLYKEKRTLKEYSHTVWLNTEAELNNIIKGLAETPTVYVLSYIFSSMFIYKYETNSSVNRTTQE